ncbi:hypothetical protein GUJ93_ZPchr0010g9680 [Zizania palustris]|uniref:Uncharacterized protein n=1 Tax=Zizania palustris TaxID=103762 RepID=A0A8J5WGM4_ZIZPA|nr:hypothetical protein GUJ93_ZPchr0010g9680 [Zizania palustris]
MGGLALHHASIKERTRPAASLLAPDLLAGRALEESPHREEEEEEEEGQSEVQQEEEETQSTPCRASGTARRATGAAEKAGRAAAGNTEELTETRRAERTRGGLSEGEGWRRRALSGGVLYCSPSPVANKFLSTWI